MRLAGGRVIRFGIPVDPGNLLFLGNIGTRPVIGLPGCARSPALITGVLRYYRISILIVVALMIAGAWSFITLPRGEDPAHAALRDARRDASQGGHVLGERARRGGLGQGRASRCSISVTQRGL